ncbi:MAG TPA: DUF2252 family protein [Kofleriaceae bacterium]|nr:DUF2252 family protein [Kofleriaceae bacterium]
MIGLVAILACGGGEEAAPPAALAPVSRDFARNPALVARLVAHPHSYFRFINRAFSQSVCERFRDQIRAMPAVNLHGDAHVEQYAVTDHGRGLTDFDDSSAGPNVIDLVRFGVSLALAAQQRGWDDRTDELVGAFLAGYRAALADPHRRPGEPAVVARMRSGFAGDRTDKLAAVSRELSPIALDAQAMMERPLARYAATIRAERPELPRHFFDRVAIGRLHAGVGSALDEKYVIRVQGRTPAPGDDVLLEAKELRRLDGIECLDTSRRADPFRILVVESRIAYTPHRYIGYARWRDKTFWIHAWDDHYSELDIADTPRTADDLREVAFDAGVQLGRGHPYQIADPLERQLRAELLEDLARLEPDVRAAIRDLSREVVASWEHFRRDMAARAGR